VLGYCKVITVDTKSLYTEYYQVHVRTITVYALKRQCLLPANDRELLVKPNKQ